MRRVEEIKAGKGMRDGDKERRERREETNVSHPNRHFR